MDNRVLHAAGFLPPHLRDMVQKLPEDILSTVQEIRLKVNRPFMVYTNRAHYVCTTGLGQAGLSYQISAQDMRAFLELLFGGSLYSVCDDLKNGFITVEGGHRVGVCGRVVLEDGKISTIGDIASASIRIARQVTGCANKVMPHITDGTKVHNTLIISPPKCGKTTLLRDIARQLSSVFKTAVCDERSELAACYRGVPQNDMGPFCDVLDNCPKALGIHMLIRSMSPEVILCDEIGTKQDVEAVQAAASCGVSIITSIHGAALEDVKQRSQAGELLARGIFECFITLSQRKGVGTVEEIACC